MDPSDLEVRQLLIHGKILEPFKGQDIESPLPLVFRLLRFGELADFPTKGHSRRIGNVFGSMLDILSRDASDAKRDTRLGGVGHGEKEGGYSRKIDGVFEL